MTLQFEPGNRTKAIDSQTGVIFRTGAPGGEGGFGFMIEDPQWSAQPNRTQRWFELSADRIITSELVDNGQGQQIPRIDWAGFKINRSDVFDSLRAYVGSDAARFQRVFTLVVEFLTLIYKSRMDRVPEIQIT